MIDFKKNSLLFLIGFIGVVSLIPFIPKLLYLQPKPLIVPIPIIQIILTIQTSVILILMVFLGSFFSRKVNLYAPVISAVCKSNSIFDSIRPQVLPGVISGLMGGLTMLIYIEIGKSIIPEEFNIIEKYLSIPWYSKLLYGGITEEIIMRWGLMSFFVWLVYRVSNEGIISNNIYMIGIFISSIIFGVSHLPVIFSLPMPVTLDIILYVITGNTIFGILFGYLYWKYGLECSMISHITVHSSSMILSNIIGLC